MTNEAYERGVKIHEQMEEFLKKNNHYSHSSILEEEKLYENEILYSGIMWVDEK